MISGVEVVLFSIFKVPCTEDSKGDVAVGIL
jgi:hypothetical protein